MGRNLFAVVLLALLFTAFFDQADRTTADEQVKPDEAKEEEIKAKVEPKEITSDKVAVIDIDKVLSEHIELQNKLYLIKKAKKEHDDDFNAKLKALNASEKEIVAQFVPGVNEVKEQRVKFAKTRAEFKAAAEFEREDFKRRQAKAYDEAYSEIVREVKAFAEKFEISMMVNFDDSKTDSGDLDSVTRRTKRRVVMHHRRDLTTHILKAVNEGAEPIAKPPLDPEKCQRIRQVYGIGPTLTY